MNKHHPSQTVERKSNWLAGKKVWVGVTGSIAAVEVVGIVRELLRHGAEVRIVASKSSLEIVGEKALEFACGQPIVKTITGQVEHVVAGLEADLLILSPCSATTIGKILHGIGDTAPALFAMSCMGAGVPLLIAPAMDGKMEHSKIVQKNLEQIRGMASLVEPRREEGKVKLATKESIVANACKIIGPGKLTAKRVLVIGGGTIEPLDEVRCITNRSSGKMAISLANAAFAMGGDVDLWLGNSEVEISDWLNSERFRTLNDLEEMVNGMDRYDVVLLPAALADFRPVAKSGKIESGKKIEITLEPTEKLLPKLREKHKGILISFKLEAGLNDEKLIDSGKRLLKYSDAVVGNLSEALESDKSRTVLITNENVDWLEGRKEDIAESLIEWAAAQQA